MKGTPFSGMLVADAVATKPTDEEVVSLVNELNGVPCRDTPYLLHRALLLYLFVL